MSETANKRISWWHPEVGNQERELLLKVLDSNFLNEGEFTTQFEERIAELLGCKHVIAASSGTTALFMALKGVGVGHGDEVIVPDLTFIASANAVSLTGAKPILVDVNPCTATIDPAVFEQAITPRTKAVMPVHVSGRGADMELILGIASSRGLGVIEDAAEALLSKYNGKFLGVIGQAGCLSFSPNKTITTGQGGAILTNDDDLALRFRMLKDQGRPVRGTGGNDIHESIGFNFKLTNLQAAVGLGQLSLLADRIQRIRTIHQIYSEELEGVERIALLPFDIEGGEIPQWVDARADDRDGLVAYLKEYNIDCRKFWYPLHTQKPYKMDDSRFPVSSTLAYQLFWLPSAFSLSEEDVRYTCDRIRAYYRAA